MDQAIRIPITQPEYGFPYRSSARAFLPDSAAQCQLLPSPSKHYSKIRQGGVGSVIARVIKIRENMDTYVHGIRDHVKLGPKLSETLKGKLNLGARILRTGGVAKMFEQNFNIRNDEKLVKASQCFLSTTAGPIAGLLFVSDCRVAFCSERSIKVSSPNEKLIRAHYKVMIPLRKIKRIMESVNVKNSRQKYVQVVTEDNFEFWFMGFLNHRRALNYIHQAIHQLR